MWTLILYVKENVTYTYPGQLAWKRSKDHCSMIQDASAKNKSHVRCKSQLSGGKPKRVFDKLPPKKIKEML